MTSFFLLITIACTDYEVHSLNQDQPMNWYDEASSRYRDNVFSTDTGMDSDTGFDDLEEVVVPEGLEDDSSGEPNAGGDEEMDTEDGSEREGYSGGGSTPGDSGEDDGGPSEDEDWGGSPSARGPGPGEVIFTELMIYPRFADDNVGEWFELRNVGTVWMDLAGYRLADRGVDDTEIVPVSDGSLLVAPGEMLIICASADYWSNGGVECDGTYHYWTFGGGFALSNTEDEVRLLTPSGGLVDEVRYSEGFASEGESIGLTPSVTSSLLNDDVDHWCDQLSLLPFGDSGTPGHQNDVCW